MDTLSQTFFALSDPTRRAILSQLARGEASVGELAQPFDISVRAVSKHVSILERAGLITRERSAQRRLSQLKLSPLHEVEAWLAPYRQQWMARLDNIDGVLAAIQSGELPEHGDD